VFAKLSDRSTSPRNERREAAHLDSRSNLRGGQADLLIASLMSPTKARTRSPARFIVSGS
jgi:hypothetical protein